MLSIAWICGHRDRLCALLAEGIYEDGAERYGAVSTAYVSMLLHSIANNAWVLILMKERTRPLHTFHARLSSRPIMHMPDVAVWRCWLATGMELLRRPISFECKYVDDTDSSMHARRSTVALE